MNEEAGPQVSLERLRAEGAWRLDPARFHFLEALSRRMADQAEPVRRVMQDKLHAGVAEYARRFALAQESAGALRAPVRRKEAARCEPLALLNAYIRTATTERRGESAEADELASVHRFRQAWSRGHAQERVVQASARKPANAGPLNSHALVLQALEAMGEISADYLRRFMGHVEALQWLEKAAEKYPARPSRQAKAGQAASAGKRKPRRAGKG